MSDRIAMKAVPGYFNSKPGIQVGTKMEGKVYRDEHGKIVFDENGKILTEEYYISGNLVI